MNWTLINTAEQLSNFCESLIKEAPAFITVDCEFVRQTTYWPELGLIQLASPSQAVIIDPIVNQIPLEPLKVILNHLNIIKVFHSGRQDIEIFYRLFQECPFPVFDTQIAAAFVGLGEGLGYEKLVFELLQLKIDKAEQFTNWLQRPLSSRQLDYAINDVIYLRQVYLLLNERLNTLGRQDWIQESFQELSNPKNYFTHPQEAWKKLKPSFSNWRYFSILWDLATWREEYAQTHNVSRSFLADNGLLIDLSCHLLLSKSEFKKFLSSYRQKILALDCFDEFYNSYEKAFSFLSSDSLELEERKKALKDWQMKQAFRPLTIEQKNKTTQIFQKFEELSQFHNIPISHLATRRDIEAYIRSPNPNHKFLMGWRKPLLADLLTEF